jgi:hypothetical protein
MDEKKKITTVLIISNDRAFRSKLHENLSLQGLSVLRSGIAGRGLAAP